MGIMLARDITILKKHPKGKHKLIHYKGLVLAVYKDGRVWDFRANKYLTTHKDKDGYLIGNKKGIAFKVHRLILIVWDRPPRKGAKEQGLHKNDIKNDNRIKNLYWGTGVENWIDRKRNTKIKNK